MTGTAITAYAGITLASAWLAWWQIAPAQSSMPFDIRELTGLGAFILLVFYIGIKLHKSSERIAERVIVMTGEFAEMRAAISTNTDAQNKVAVALEAFTAQQVVANKATVESQNHLADRNLKQSLEVSARIEESLVKIMTLLIDQRRGGRGEGRRGSRAHR